jgi:DNA adenine methylase
MRFLRYPGGKARHLCFLQNYLPRNQEIERLYIEPFVGGGSVFLSLKPYRALLADINVDLIDLYKGISNYPHKVWEIFRSFPKGKQAYYSVRDTEYSSRPLYYRAARILYLNRTCFKGMWRHSSTGNFSVGYGGEARRWSISHQNIITLAELFRRAALKACDFEDILNEIHDGDFIYLDPPYKPGERELIESHYAYGKFTFDDQKRLAVRLSELSDRRSIMWLMTNSAHEDIKRLYNDFFIREIPFGTGNKIGVYTRNPKEIIISNYRC